MPRTRHLAVALATFGVTIGAGFVTQNRDALLGRPAPAPTLAGAMVTPPPPALVALTASGATPVLAAATPRPLPEGGPFDAALSDVVPVAFEEPDTALPLPGAACALVATATPAPQATVDLALDAPCAAGQAVAVHHAGLVFDLVLDGAGHAAARVPALAADGVFAAETASGLAAAAVAPVRDLALYDRAAVQWRGAVAPEVHARAYGAPYGAPGHVWRGAPGSWEAVADGTGGVLTTLGDPALPDARRAEVYTFPSAQAAPGAVALTVEAEVTPATCGQPLDAQSIQVSPGAPPIVQDLAMTLPGCDATGQIVSLPNLLLGLTVAGG